LLATQSWRLTLDDWPQSVRAASTLAIPFAPFRALSAARVYDADGAAETLPAASYHAPPADGGGRVIFVSQPPAPRRPADGIEIDFSVGYGAGAADTPAPLRQAILSLVAYWRENRGDVADGSLPRAVAQLAAPFRRERLL
jgi:uncharacterized phiE125 gp8 family phage protein